MKKIITTLFVSCLLITVSCSAQKGRGNMDQMLKDSLHLTDVQVDSVTAIHKDIGGKIKAVNSNTSLTADQKKEQIRPLRQEMKTRMKGVLTADQMTKMEAMKHEMHDAKKTDDDTQ